MYVDCGALPPLQTQVKLCGCVGAATAKVPRKVWEPFEQLNDSQTDAW